jgi:hypothetical protein
MIKFKTTDYFTGTEDVRNFFNKIIRLVMFKNAMKMIN